MSRHRKTPSGSILAVAAVALPMTLVAGEGSSSPQARAEQLLREMSLEQKIQQIANKPESVDLPSGTYRSAKKADAQCGFTQVGRRITGIPELGIPTFREINGGNGVRGGDCVPEPVRTAGPSMTLAAASFDPELVEAWGEVVGSETASFAHQVLLGPALNLIRSPFAGRAQEYASEDPYLTGIIGSAQIRGIQSQGVQAMIKHFAGNEHEFQFERWTAASRIPSRAMHELYLLPFEMAIKDAKPASIMCAYPHLNGAWVCDSQAALVKTLRDRWGFDGWIESDRRAMHSTAKSLRAGVAYELDEKPVYYSEEKIMASIERGHISEADIDAALKPRYAKMFEFGQFDNPFNQFVDVDLQANAAKARALGEAGITLLKNDLDTLPLKPEVNSIALIGHEWFAGSAAIAPRNGDPRELATVVPPFTVTPKEGLEKYAPTVVYNDGTNIEEAVELARNAQVAVVMVGTTPRETRDLVSIKLPRICKMDKKEEDAGDGDGVLVEDVSVKGGVCIDQEEVIRQVSAANPNTVVVLYGGAGVLMDWLEQVPALVAAWFPGQEAGAIVADVLFGTINPSGKLPVTFPVSEREAAWATEKQYPGVHEDTGIPGGPGREPDPDKPQLVSYYSENLAMGYRWYEANGITPTFPFGHGLSYTTFGYSNLTLSKASRSARKGKDTVPVPVLNVSYTVTNTGPVAGAEASQVYLELPRQAGQPSKRLVGFKKVFLDPGESTQVSVVIDSGASNHPFSYFVPDNPDKLSAWANGEWATQSGEYRVYVGGSSADTPLVDSIGMGFPKAEKEKAKAGKAGRRDQQD